jgi:endonuclease YncB( thermonuclease family)
MKVLPLALLLAAAISCAANASAQQRKPPPPPEAKPASDCSATAGELPKAWDGQAFAIDGHTLGGTGLKAHLRIWGIQAPDLRDATRAESVTGMRARAFLADLLAKADHKVKCRPARFDRECRIVAQCSLADPGGSSDLGGSMIAGGMAYGPSGWATSRRAETKAGRRRGGDGAVGPILRRRTAAQGAADREGASKPQE